MKGGRLFILLIFLLSLVFLFADLPKKVSLGKFSLGFSKIDFHLFGKRIQKEFSYRLGLDLQGGIRLVYKVDLLGIPESEKEAAFESTHSIIERRINFFGVVEPLIQTQKVGEERRIIVELPGAIDLTHAQGLIGKTAQLTFWEGKPGVTPSGMLIATQSAGVPFGITAFLGEDPIKTKLTGKHLRTTRVVFDPTTGEPQVELRFKEEGTKLFAELTHRNVGKPLAIVLDEQLLGQPPTVREPILQGNAVITGNFTTETARNLSIALNAGALPAPLRLIGESLVGPSLGIDSLKKSLFGGFLGFASIVIFMVYLYRKEGLLACLALVVYVTIVLFIFKIIPVTLTLAGIAGFVLSIGMAVDANILIFERMREELRAGKPQDFVVRLGFLRAWTSIRDSNISSLITCAILYYFGSGIIRGFALTLAIGILVSMFSAITVTRNLLRVFEKK